MHRKYIDETWNNDLNELIVYSGFVQFKNVAEQNCNLQNREIDRKKNWCHQIKSITHYAKCTKSNWSQWQM